MKKKTAKTAKTKPRRTTKREPKLPAFDFDALEATLLDEARSAFAQLRANHPKYHFYCMALFTGGELSYVAPTAMSEEGLTDDTLRWSAADSPHHDEVDFDEANTRMRELAAVLRTIDVLEDRPTFDAFVARTHEVFFRVLHALDEEGCFGKGAKRAKIFVSVMMGDRDRSELVLGERLNPPATFKRYRDAWG